MLTICSLFMVKTDRQGKGCLKGPQEGNLQEGDSNSHQGPLLQAKDLGASSQTKIPKKEYPQ